MTMYRYIKDKRGFTLLELLAVMAIMLIMASVAIMSYKSMLTGTGAGAAVAHLRQTLELARQEAIMRGKSAFVVFYQDDTEAWYVTCLGEGYKTDGALPQNLIDRYNGDMRGVAVGTVLFNLSMPTPKFSPIIQVEPNVPGIPGAAGITTLDAIWSIGDRYGWEVSQKVRLPRGFRFKEAPDTVRFKPNGTAVNVSGGTVAGDIVMIEEIKPTVEFGLVVDITGLTKPLE